MLCSEFEKAESYTQAIMAGYIIMLRAYSTHGRVWKIINQLDMFFYPRLKDSFTLCAQAIMSCCHLVAGYCILTIQYSMGLSCRFIQLEEEGYKLDPLHSSHE